MNRRQLLREEARTRQKKFVRFYAVLSVAFMVFLLTDAEGQNIEVQDNERQVDRSIRNNHETENIAHVDERFKDVRKIRQLTQKHNAQVMTLQQTYDLEVKKLSLEFEREAANEKDSRGVERKRDRQREKASRAYARFKEALARENERFRTERLGL